RTRLIEQLNELTRGGVTIDVRNEPAPTLFNLAYQGLDDRDINRLFTARITAPQLPPAQLERAPLAGRKLKIGLISHFFRDHTMGRLNQGLVATLSRERFDVTVLSVGDPRDEVAQFFRANADRYVVLPPALSAARHAIAAEKLDILFYADLGMDPVTYSLAFSRLAPVQCVTWGHPVTSGIGTIDYFISSHSLDPPGNEAHYTEELVRLKSLAVYYYRPQLPPSPKMRGNCGRQTPIGTGLCKCSGSSIRSLIRF